jgi:hypothetical protein
MALTDLSSWLNEVSKPQYVWLVKRLSGNDTLANDSNQAGPYLPKEFAFSILPALNRVDEKNPSVWLDAHIDSHPDSPRIRAVYYNSKLHESKKNGRNEVRLTNFGGKSSAVLNPESTGALTIFAFTMEASGTPQDCRIWVCRHVAEEDLIEDRVGPVEPGEWALWPLMPSRLVIPKSGRTSCWLEQSEIPLAWLTNFPTGAEIVAKTVEMRPDGHLPPDRRLLRRRDCEFEVFRSLEEAVEAPAVKMGLQLSTNLLRRLNPFFSDERQERVDHLSFIPA